MSQEQESSLSLSRANSHSEHTSQPLKTVLRPYHKGLRTSNRIIKRTIHHLKAVKGPGSPRPACAAAPPAVLLRAKGEVPPRPEAPWLARRRGPAPQRAARCALRCP